MRKSRCLPLLALFVALSYGCWQYLFSIYRYLSTLEWLVPLFLSLTLAYCLRSQRVVLTASLLINLVLCSTIFPYDNGRINFDHDFLKVDISSIPPLDHYLILMGGPEPTSYIIPQFPRRTRFVRISGNWMAPRQNKKLDRQIYDSLSQYPVSRILLYCANEEEIRNAGITLYPLGMSKSDDPCYEIGPPLKDKGFLCKVKMGNIANFPSSNVQLMITILKPGGPSDATPAAAVANDTLVFHVTGIPSGTIDVLGTLDGRALQPQRRWMLNASGEIRLKVGGETPKGLYRFIGVRNSYDPDPNQWIAVDAYVWIR